MIAMPDSPGTLLHLPGCAVEIEPDWLFERMAAAGQGWCIRNEHGEQRPVLSHLDLAILETVQQSAQRHVRLAVGVPRVVVGLALVPAIYAALRVLLQTARPSDPGTIGSFPIRADERLLVASRSHAIRDLLAESVLTFNRHETRLAQFPTYRLSRDGSLVQGVFGRLPTARRPRPDQMLVTAPPLVVYDYWPIPSDITLSRMAAVFAELAENDGADTVERLRDVVERTQARFAVVVVNINDIGKRARLADLGFTFMAAWTDDGGRAAKLSPTFTGVDRVAPKSHRVTFHCSPDDDPVVQPLSEAFRLLAEVHGRLSWQDPYPTALRRAWYVLDQLASCPSTLARYERLRRYDAYIQSLHFRLERLERVNWELVPDSVRGSLITRWPHVIELLRRAYDLLMQSNPKWWELAELVIDAQTPQAVILSNRLAAQSLREDLLIEFGWSETESPVQIRALSETRRNDERFDRVIILSQWSDQQRGVLFSLMPREVTMLGYSFEGPVLEKRLEAMQLDLDTTVASETCATLARLIGARARAVGARNGSAVRWDTEVLARARRAARRHWTRPQSEHVATQHDAGDDLIYERAAARVTGAPPPSEDAVDAAVEMVALSFTGGARLVVPINRELLVLPAAGEATEERFPADLAPGDRVLLLTSDEHADLFLTALARTNHLISGDARVLDRWRETLVALRHEFPPAVYGVGARFVDALRQLRCDRDAVTIRGWLRGSTMAPRETDDIARVLQVAGEVKDVDRLATLVAREVNVVRDFHRRIGRRIGRRLLAQGAVDETRGTAYRIDQEIDELLEQTDLRTVASVEIVPTTGADAALAEEE